MPEAFPSIFALKEWAVICEALNRGLQIITLRKGGIEEEEGIFVPRHREFLLYPTLEHQKPAAIKPQHQSLFTDLQTRPPPSHQILFNLWATCERIHPVKTKKTAIALAAYTIWTPETLATRFDLYPEKPLLLLLLQVYKLRPPLLLPEDPSYAGCRSWVPLVKVSPLEDRLGSAVMPAGTFQQTAQKIDAIASSA